MVEVVARLEAEIATQRLVAQVRVERSAKLFEDHTETKAIYATGWDGTVVFETGADGAWRVASAPPLP